MYTYMYVCVCIYIYIYIYIFTYIQSRQCLPPSEFRGPRRASLSILLLLLLLLLLLMIIMMIVVTIAKITAQGQLQRAAVGQQPRGGLFPGLYNTI